MLQRAIYDRFEVYELRWQEQFRDTRSWMSGCHVQD